MTVQLDNTNAIRIGDFVAIRWEDDEEWGPIETYQIAYPTEDYRENKISPRSPVGAILLGSAPGRTIEYTHKARTLKMVILAAWPVHEEATGSGEPDSSTRPAA